MTVKKVNVKKERFYSTHHDLFRIAKYNLEQAEAQEDGYFDWQFITIIMCSLTVEAFCNAVGEKVIDNWKDFESCSPIAKTRLICEHLDVNYDDSRQPWGGLIWLSKTRNLIAHPKAEEIIDENEMTLQEHQNYDREMHRNAPKSKLENIVTLDNAKKSVATVKQLIELFCEKLTDEQRFGISSDMWSSSTTFQHSHE